MNVFTLLDQAATRFPDRVAVCRGTEPVWTWRQLHERALRLAGGLRARLAPGSRVALLSANAPAYLELLFAAWAAEMVAVPVNYKLHPKETLQILDDCQASLLFVSDALAPGIAAEAAAPAFDTVVIGSAAHEALAAAPAAAAPRDTMPEALAWLFYTSGTTGRSKGAMLTPRNLMAMTLAHLADVETFDENASLLHAAPMSHGSGIYALPYVARAARQVIAASGGFDPVEFLQLASEHPGCGAFLAPTMVQRLRLAVEAGAPKPTQLRTIVYGGGPMYLEEIRRSLQVFGDVFVQIYGQGESPMTITVLRREDHRTADDAVLASVGWARSGVQVAVVDADDRPLPPGGIGEVVCRGDVVMAGYWRNEKASAETLRGGWLHTGDVGMLDARGYLTLRDRSKDVIISGGSNIYPREVEEALLKHPGVSEVCVVGERDAEWGEVVVAFVVAVAGASPTAAELDAVCLDHIARFKRPKRYVFVEALPKNSYGKVLKRELRLRLAP